MTPVTFHPVIGARQLSAIVRLRDVILTILLWMVYLLSMRDFFFFLGDVADWAWHGFAHSENYKSFDILPTFLFYSEVTLVFLAVFIGWARYNQFRFRGKSRRKAAGPVTPDDLAAFYGLEPRQIETWQDAKILTVHHDKKGRIAQALKCGPCQETPPAK